MRPTDLLSLLRRSGLFVGVALLIAMAALAGFAELAEEVREAEFKAFDRLVLLWVGSHVRPAYTPYVLGLSFLGSPLGVSVVSTLFGVWLLARRKAWDAATLLVVMLGGGALTVSLKALFRQPRPDVFPPLAVELSYSFPSGHALLGLCLYGFMGYWLVAQAPRQWWRWILGAMGAALAVLIALSRLYLGVHWPTDIAAGGLAATFWLASCLVVRRWMAGARPETRD